MGWPHRASGGAGPLGGAWTCYSATRLGWSWRWTERSWVGPMVTATSGVARFVPTSRHPGSASRHRAWVQHPPASVSRLAGGVSGNSVPSAQAPDANRDHPGQCLYRLLPISLGGLILVAVDARVQVAAVGGGRVEPVVVGGRVRLLLTHWWAPQGRRGSVGGPPAAGRPAPGPCRRPGQPARPSRCRGPGSRAPWASDLYRGREDGGYPPPGPRNTWAVVSRAGERSTESNRDGATASACPRAGVRRPGRRRPGRGAGAAAARVPADRRLLDPAG